MNIIFWVFIGIVVEILLGSLAGHLLSRIGRFYPVRRLEGGE